MKDIIKSFKRGYYKPSTMPLWKLMIVYFFWIISLLGYILSPVISRWFVIVGVAFQTLALYLPTKWDTGKWKNTDKGKEYLDKYGK